MPTIIVITHFSIENQENIRDKNFFKVTKKIRNYQPRILHPIKLSLEIENGVTTFSNKQKLK